ncbi:ABC transporter ATP-binding protein [Variovorax sp. UC122_21]|uniref:ABC transporter ATP-binding protein n=1 Tax=Variovorax sp. UC122_21 TaxID=3374554 RepID=UPI003756ABF3
MSGLEAAQRVLDVQGLSLAFGGVQALADVSFDVKASELLAIIGPNGAGKSSLFNCLSSIYAPQRGSIRLNGHELVGRPTSYGVSLGLGRTFQNLGLFDNADVETNLMLGRHPLMKTGFLSAALWRGKARDEEIAHRERVDELVDLLKLREACGRPVGLLPYGTRKLVELGRALAMEPSVLLMDEPVAGMNREERDHMALTIHQVRQVPGTTIVLVEHDVGFVMDLADRVMVLEFGRVIQFGDPDTVRNDPRVIEAYLGAAAHQ